jgi:hypothetical protein
MIEWGLCGFQSGRPVVTTSQLRPILGENANGDFRPELDIEAVTRKKPQNPEDVSPPAKFSLPGHWPAYTTDGYYAWMMDKMPADAIPADWSRHKPHNSYSPLFWYEDQPLVCVDCATKFVFTKEEQRRWYEDLQLPIQVRCIRCPECRRKIRTAKVSQKKHMEELAHVEPHPHEAFFKRRKPE